MSQKVLCCADIVLRMVRWLVLQFESIVKRLQGVTRQPQQSSRNVKGVKAKADRWVPSAHPPSLTFDNVFVKRDIVPHQHATIAERGKFLEYLLWIFPLLGKELV